jgi:tetratricopeptide (TPR) repeat protein
MASSGVERWDFFVSYAQADREWAVWIAWQLRAEGYRVLFQEWDMVPGRNWVHRMDAGSINADRTVAVVSPAYLASAYGALEWQAAVRRDPMGEKRLLVPVLIGGIWPDGLLAQFVGIDLVGLDADTARRRLRDDIAAAVSGDATPATEPFFPAVVSAEPRFPAAGIWNVRPRNPNFIGRASEVNRIRAGLAAHTSMTVHSLHGMGGVGKTETAIEYAYRYASDYDLVWWISAEQPALIADQLVALSVELGFSFVADSDSAVAAVRAWLRRRDRWLLVFDNATNVDHVRTLLPGGAGHVLITTRWSGFRSLGDVLDLDVPDRPTAVALLRRRAPTLTDSDADAIAGQLGDLPLALDQAAAYLDQTGMPPAEYLHLLRTRTNDMHVRGRSTGHPDTIASVWSISLDTLLITQPAAIQLLGLCAWLAAEPVPLDLFTANTEHLPEPLATAAADPVAFTDTVTALTDCSLTRRTSYDLLTHRLIQDVTRQSPPTGPAAPLALVLGLLRADLPGDITETREHWPRWRRLLPHVLAATTHHDDAHPVAADATRWLLNRAATYQQAQGRPFDAHPLFQRALHLAEATYGHDHPEVADALNDLGHALQVMGRPADAQPLHLRALEIDATAHGRDHPAVASDLNHLAMALRDLGWTLYARELFEHAKRIDEAAYGPDHLAVARDLNSLAVTFCDMGGPSFACPLFERALAIAEAAYGTDHPKVATCLNNLAMAYRSLGALAEALPLLQRAISIDEAVYGPDHPAVAGYLNNLATVLLKLNQPAEAHPLLERAITITEAAYGPDHPTVATYLSNLSWTRLHLGQLAESLPPIERAVSIKKKYIETNRIDDHQPAEATE